MIANGVTEVGCMAHARRKFFELHVANKSQIAEYALGLIGQFYGIEREAKALDYTLKRWQALTRYFDDGQLPIDNNWIENPIPPIAI